MFPKVFPPPSTNPNPVPCLSTVAFSRSSRLELMEGVLTFFDHSPLVLSRGKMLCFFFRPFFAFFLLPSSPVERILPSLTPKQRVASTEKHPFLLPRVSPPRRAPFFFPMKVIFWASSLVCFPPGSFVLVPPCASNANILGHLPLPPDSFLLAMQDLPPPTPCGRRLILQIASGKVSFNPLWVDRASSGNYSALFCPLQFREAKIFFFRHAHPHGLFCLTVPFPFYSPWRVFSPFTLLRDIYFKTPIYLRRPPPLSLGHVNTPSLSALGAHPTFFESPLSFFANALPACPLSPEANCHSPNLSLETRFFPLCPDFPIQKRTPAFGYSLVHYSRM